MANQNKLKAWVRYDGTGRVVTGGPIFQAKKPKVGNWKQINANLCCNGSTPSTTTTTTTAGVFYYYKADQYICPNTASPVALNVTIVSNAPISIGKYVASSTNPEIIFQVTDVTTYSITAQSVNAATATYSSYSLCSAITTTTTTVNPNLYNAGYVINGITPVCNNQGPFHLPLSVDPNACSNGGITLLSGNYSDYGINNGATIYINLKNGSVIQVQVFGSSSMSFGCTSCSGTTTTTTTTQNIVFYNADYTNGPVGNVCAGTGQYNLPLVFPNGFCSTGSLSLAPGYTWSQFGIGSFVTLTVKDVNSNNITQINVQTGSAASNYTGCTGSC